MSRRTADQSGEAERERAEDRGGGALVVAAASEDVRAEDGELDRPEHEQ